MQRTIVLVGALLAVSMLAASPAYAVKDCFSTGKGAPGPFKVEFQVGSTKIDAASAKLLDDVAKVAKARYSRLCLLGRADKQGNAKANFDLSVRRAEAVAKALEQRGISDKNITVVGRGEPFGDTYKFLTESQADRSVDITLSQ